MTAITALVESDCDFSRAMFRRARVEASRARRFATKAGERRDVSSEMERHCVASAVTLAAVAAQDWVTWALLSTRLPIPSVDKRQRHSSLERWRRLPQVAWSLGRAHDFGLSETQESFLEDLGAWHGALSYADPRAQARLLQQLVSGGFIDGRQNETHVIRAELAIATVTSVGRLFSWAHSVTGLPTPVN